MKITIQPRSSRVIATLRSQELGYLAFELRDRRLVNAYTTYVAPEARGQGVAERLVEALATHCRERQWLIEPSCSYVAHWLLRHEAYADLLEGHDASGEVAEQIRQLGSPERQRELMRFFKTGAGMYAEGDLFAGVAVPDLRRLMRQRAPWSRSTILSLLVHELHEARWLGFALLSQWIEQADSTATHAELYRLYLEHLDYCNNWDLVNHSAPKILGTYLAPRPEIERHEALLELALSGHLWRTRVAMVGTLGLIYRGIATDTLYLAEQLLGHQHDLIHKAVGWMLREVGKRIDQGLLCDFLERHAPEMPRTALRYALEHLSPEQRHYYLHLR